MSDPSTPAEAAPTQVLTQSPQIQFDDFTKIDLRVATVKEAMDHPNADKLLLLKLDDGTPEGRQICAGIKGHYEPDQLVGRQIIIVANLAPRKMRGEVSQGMLLAASSTATNSDEHPQVVLLSPMSNIAPGSRVG